MMLSERGLGRLLQHTGHSMEAVDSNLFKTKKKHLS